MPSIAKKISKFTKREIDHLFQHARRAFKSELCTILLAPRQQEFARILIIASRKVGNAPERNLIRRRIKSIFYEEKLFERNFDCVIIAQKKLIELPFDQLKDLILGAYQKA
jgi:ribonuclease P protein component